MTRRERDALIRNRRPLYQERLNVPKPKMPKKGTKITITYTDKEKDMVSRIREFVERHGLEVEFVKI